MMHDNDPEYKDNKLQPAERAMENVNRSRCIYQTADRCCREFEKNTNNQNRYGPE